MDLRVSSGFLYDSKACQTRKPANTLRASVKFSRQWICSEKEKKNPLLSSCCTCCNDVFSLQCSCTVWACELCPWRGVMVPISKHLHRAVWASVIQALKTGCATFPNDSWSPFAKVKRAVQRARVTQQLALFLPYPLAYLSYMEVLYYGLCYYSTEQPQAWTVALL